MLGRGNGLTDSRNLLLYLAGAEAENDALCPGGGRFSIFSIGISDWYSERYSYSYSYLIESVGS